MFRSIRSVSTFTHSDMTVTVRFREGGADDGFLRDPEHVTRIRTYPSVDKADRAIGRWLR